MAREHKKIERFILFSEVAKELSFTKAASRLSMSRGYLSDQIKQLEKDVGTPLLIRSTRKVTLTKEGEHFMRGMENIRNSISSLEQRLEEQHLELEQENQPSRKQDNCLHIVAPRLFSHCFLAKLCHEFKEQNASTSFVLENLAQDKKDPPLTSSKSSFEQTDFVFQTHNSSPQGMHIEALFPFHRVCAASPKYLAQQGRPRTPEELTKHKCLVTPDEKHWQFKSTGVQINEWLAMDDELTLLNEAIAGRGIVYLPNYALDPYINSGELESILTNDCVYGQSVYVASSNTSLQPLPQTTQAKCQKAFFSFIQAKFQEHKYEPTSRNLSLSSETSLAEG